jgi:hypothetical protein
MVSYKDKKVITLLSIKYGFSYEEALKHIEEFEKNKKRQSVEYNGMELLFAILLKYSEINDSSSLLLLLENESELSSNISFNTPEDVKLYIKDLKIKKQLLNDFISNFRKNEESLLLPSMVEKIYLSGKINKQEEINLINKGIDKKEAKADVYVKLLSGEFIGFSVKQSKQATKSNYSVQKMFGTETDNKLTEIRHQYLNDNGVVGFDKSQRKKVNELFYPKNTQNPYWEEIKKLIKENNKELSTKIVSYLHCINVPYCMYEFDGETIYKLSNTVNLDSVVFDEHMPYYYDSKGKLRNAAKLFYRLEVEGKKYRVEVRWKGDVYNSSPQFQLHEE